MKINKISIIITYFFVVIMAFSITSCADELAELNENPNAIEDLPYGLQLTEVQLDAPGGRYEMRRAALGWGIAAVQQLADVSIATSILPGDKYIDFIDYSFALFDRYYLQEAKEVVDFVTRTAEDPEAVNYNAIGRILKVMSFHKVTDLYGDIPYSEAGLGYLTNNWFPAYDRQEDIYADMLSELEAAAVQLSSSAENPGTQDVMYGGDLTKWRKLSYSMMLRLGLRLSKVDPAASESWVKKAIAGGVMTDLDDVAKVEHEIGGVTSPIGDAFDVDKFMRLSDTFVSWMEDHGDPRLDILSWVENGGPHQGLPNGLDPTTLTTEGPAGGDILDYSQVNQALVQRDSPSMFMTYAEVEFMLAEAAVRGWYNGDAETHYNNGVRAAMENWSFYGVSTPSTAEVDNYLSSNPYNATNALEMIGEQYWAATFLNPWESYSNWRRIEYPVLTPVNYPGNATGGTIPRRLKYPIVEFNVNAENVNAAISNQGPNDYTTRVWWDK
ncbi:SusD/RagB family nutrient-binding outer membrane lipoprotein [Snuella sedimenti]|uniref:SusD/RagB family nutrient-binding outer membrane lipoprotein n=1 Tax=Snuella sedimenti TaxID=2798802 RepID=A0A8J7LST9_9FLAO|nr:SusD/RagB family nutrient-binding outer membrane lipoprotein [Snuella sedimenti]MBJ6368790.1 SusD/RagB family nutrient-binding outer membrane lipoprotein [Snuella sedimenti]